MMKKTEMMKINRNNYEEFFLLYADNELTAEERAIVEGFVTLHPDLGEELNILTQTRLPAEEQFIYTDKASLLRHADIIPVNEYNYNEYFLSYVDNELNPEEKKSVETFIALHKDKQAELLLLQRVKMQPEENIRFHNKDILYRTEKKPARIAYMRWVSIAAAAAVIVTGIAVWTNINNNETVTGDNANALIAGTNAVKESSDQQKQAIPGEITSSNEEDVATGEKITGKADRSADHQPQEKIAGRKESKNTEPVSSAFQKATIAEEKNENNIALAPVNEQITERIHNKPVVNEQQIAAGNNIATPDRDVKPLILDETAFSGADKPFTNENQAAKHNDPVVFFDTDDNDKKPKGKLRGLLRKASRIIDHATNAGEANNQQVVRVASFEIAKK